MTETNNDFNQPAEIQQESELSFTDKMVGVITSPGETYESIAKFPVKATDWLVPFFIALVFVILSTYLITSNPAIKTEIKKKQTEAIEKNFQKAIDEGKITKEQAQEQMTQIEQQMEQFSGGTGMIFQTVGILVFGSAFFFLIALIYFAFARYLLKGVIDYKGVLMASGLASYITILNVIVVTAISLGLGKLYQDVSVASFISMEDGGIVEFFLRKLDPFSVWAYAVTGIGIAKMAKSTDTLKFIIMVFGIWIIGGLILHFISQALGGFFNFG